MLRASSFFAAVLLGLGYLAASASGRQPNIVLVLADDVGREVLECYGGQSYATPRLNQLAAQGLRFEQAHVMPVCHPTRISLLTGQYPFRLDNPEWGTFPRDAENRTLASMLKRAGYATAIAGKWQLAVLGDDLEQPHRMGFDEYCLLGWHEGAWYYEPVVWQNGRRRDDVQGKYGHDIDLAYLTNFIRRHKDQPFFAFYQMVLCHSETNDLDHPAPTGPLGRYLSYSEMVAAMDQRVGRVVDLIDELGLSQDTLIVFVTDNGSPKQSLIDDTGGKYVYEQIVSKYRGRDIPGGKGDLTDWGTRVPLIVRWPSVVKPGQVTGDLVDASDFLPTIAEIAGASPPADVHLDGQSFASRILHNEPAPRSWAFAEHMGNYFVKDRRWKLYKNGQFFNVENDPDEKSPLATDRLEGSVAGAFKRLSQARDQTIGNAQPK